MHEPEKSDSVVVAGKPANKAERFAAEPVEPRTEAKGNAGQQSTRRAQDRASVSQALERVRQAARRKARKKGEVHLAPAPGPSRHAETGVLRDEAGRCARRGRLDVGDLRRGSRSKYLEPARQGQ